MKRTSHICDQLRPKLVALLYLPQQVKVVVVVREKGRRSRRSDVEMGRELSEQLSALARAPLSRQARKRSFLMDDGEQASKGIPHMTSE